MWQGGKYQNGLKIFGNNIVEFLYIHETLWESETHLMKDVRRKMLNKLVTAKSDLISGRILCMKWKL